MNAAAANELNNIIGFDLSLAGELADWQDEQEADAEAERRERQRQNAAFGEWLGMY
ncbi:MAG TPA: hypothetical protein VGB98_10840 [Pyrinomonadaceae bacterium]|jgi:hypothetical protein